MCPLRPSIYSLSSKILMLVALFDLDNPNPEPPIRTLDHPLLLLIPRLSWRVCASG